MRRDGRAEGTGGFFRSRADGVFHGLLGDLLHYREEDGHSPIDGESRVI